MKNLKVFFLLLFNGSFCPFYMANGQSPQEVLSSFWEEQFEKIDQTWNSNGYWGTACEDWDNRFNEAILIYCKMGKDSCLYYDTKVNKAIRFSFENLQHSSGAMMQLGRPNHVRTSLFLYGVANALSKHPDLFEEESIKKGFEKAVRYLERPHPFSSNHNMAAMLAFRMLHHVTKEDRFLKLFLNYRKLTIGSYFEVDRTKGYWPESEKKWANRLSVPYLFVQSYFLMEFLKNFEDEEINELYQKQQEFLRPRISLEGVSVNVTGSNGNFKKKGIENVQISAFTFFADNEFAELSTPLEVERVIKKTGEMFIKKCEKHTYLNHTDLYYRFGMALAK